MEDLPEPPAIPVQTLDGCTITLRRHPGGGAPVLLVHGASASSRTFRVGETRSLASYLNGHGLDVWTLDWRAGLERSGPTLREVARKDCQAYDAGIFTVDAAAEQDIPAALEEMRRQGCADKPIALLGHCMGAGVIAHSIAVGAVGGRVGPVVLSTLGLFYRGGFDNLLKAEDDPVVLLLREGEYLMHPGEPWRDACKGGATRDTIWHPELETPFRVWEASGLPHGGCAQDYCRRLAFLYGLPFHPEQIQAIHGHHLKGLFGHIPTQFFEHCVRNLRRGYAAPYGSGSGPDDSVLQQGARNFQGIKTTLITGELNSLWHRDSIDSMYEWLLRLGCTVAPTKHVFSGYVHQDLLWGAKAPAEVFPVILKGLAA